jgi:hypothetical protein
VTPLPGSPEELAAFAALKQQLAPMYRKMAHDPRAEHTVVVVPSLSFDQRELAKVKGVHHYEERLLFFLMLLRRPRTRLIYVTSQAMSPTVVDYYLHLLSGVPTSHAAKRLVCFHCADASAIPLTQKILSRPRLVARIRDSLGDAGAHLICFNSTDLERTLAVQLGIPLYANDPELNDLGSKSGSREVFREAGVLLPSGYERLKDAHEVAQALAALKTENPQLERAVVKLNDGFSGEGNAVFKYAGIDGSTDDARIHQIRERLPFLTFEAPTETWEGYEEKFRQMGGVVEAFVEGPGKKSPSAQLRINAVGRPEAISTHDQVLGGPSGQVFLGATFPADAAYRLQIQSAGMQVANVLARRGALGRFAVDFVTVPGPDNTFQHYAIEVNLRKGGTTHPFATLRFLTDGAYDPNSGEFFTPGGKPRCYFTSDNLESERYIGLLPEDLIDIMVYHDLHFHSATERGVVFHLVGALSQYGKLGVVCIGDNPQQARFLYRRVVTVLDQEVGPTPAV